jgi:hypothetical protein
MGYSGQMNTASGPIEYKRKYTLWVLIVLVLFCWPAAIVYYFTRDKVAVQEVQGYGGSMPSQAYGAPMTAPAPSYGSPAPLAPNCPRCGRPAQWIPQYGRFYCPTDQQYI